jgi:hypothetical protein
MRIAVAVLLCSAGVAFGETPLPKLGPNAVSITEDNAYLRRASAPDFWAYASFVKPQFTSSACSVAAVTAAINGLRGLPELAEDEVLSQPALLDLVADADWARLSSEDGDGVTFAQLVTYAEAALRAVGVVDAKIEVLRPAITRAEPRQATRAILSRNEQSADDVVMVYFNQGVVTGDWDGPHVALIGAYDAESDRVLVLEVDQAWYVPYWTPLEVLVEAMMRPTSAEHGPLEGETGGLVLISR